MELAHILTQQNPQIDLKLHSYEASTRNFLKALSVYKNHAISVIRDRRDNQNAERKRLSGKIQSMETDINLFKVKEIDLLADLEREQEERKVAELSVASFKRQLASIRDKCASFESEIDQYRAIKDNLRRERNKEYSILRSHAASTSPELEACEHRLCCVVEGIEKDQLLVHFSHINKSEPNREFSFVLDVSTRLYKVLTSSPALPKLPILVKQLNQSRDVYAFIQQVWSAFKDSTCWNLAQS